MQPLNYPIAIAQIRAILKQYLQHSQLQSLVIGVSGGIDSALCVALAEPVCIEMHINLIGRSIPIASNTTDEINRASAIGHAFTMDFEEMDLTKEYYAELESVKKMELNCKVKGNADLKATKIRNGNIKARMRMIRLYDLASYTGGMVLSTDNLTEYNLGFWTLNGDCGNFGMIQNLWKTEVFAVAQYLVTELRSAGQNLKADALENCVRATVTDGLGITNSTLEQLQAPNFDEVDHLLQQYLVDHKRIQNPVIERHCNSEFKRHDPYNIQRDQLYASDSTDA